MKKTFHVLLFVLLGLFAIGLGIEKSEVFAEENEYSFVINLTVPEDTPADASVYLVGNITGWSHLDEWKFSKVGDIYKLEKTVILSDPNVEFKFTLGEWDYEEVKSDGGGVSNRPLTLVVGETITADLTVEKWKAFPPEIPPQQIGTVYVHYQKWDGDYSDVGFHTWGYGTIESATYPAMPSGTDSFGAYWEVPIADNASDEIGMIVLKSGMASGTQWDNKEYSQDIFVSITSIKNGTEDTIHVYYFQGGEDQIFIARQNRVNVLVVYYDASGVYEDNLGVHAWNGWVGAYDTTWDGSSSWNTPSKVFKDGLASLDGKKGKVAMLYIDPESEAHKEWGAGFLIYAGDDDSKKTGDIGDFKDLAAGTVVPIYVLGDDVFRGEDAASQFSNTAFTFGFVPYDIETSKGTFAYKPTMIFVRFMLNIPVELDEEAEETIESRFTLKQGEDVIPIDKINYNKSNPSASEFVIYLKDENALDNTKLYTLSYAYDTNEASIELDLDRDAPTLTITGDTEIEVTKGDMWDPALFPEYRAVDNRDGTITRMVYVKPGEGSLDTGKVGQYLITLTVADEWGNEAQATFTINVIAGDDTGDSGCSSGSTIFFINLLTAAAVITFIYRKRNE